MISLIYSNEIQYQNMCWKDTITKTYKYDIITLFGIVDHDSNKNIDLNEFISVFISITSYSEPMLKKLFKEADDALNISLTKIILEGPKEELNLIEENAPTNEEAKNPPWKILLTNKALWAIAVAHFCSNYSLFVFLAWLPIFINQGLGVEFSSVGLLAMLPHLTSFIFLNIGGFFGDFLLSKGIKLLTVRKVCNTLGFGGAGICLALVPSFETVASVITIMCIGNAFSGFAAGGFIVNHADIGPKYTGTLMGITNMIGAIPGIIGVYLSGLILNATNSWDAVFYVVSGVMFFGMIFYFFFSSVEKQFD